MFAFACQATNNLARAKAILEMLIICCFQRYQLGRTQSRLRLSFCSCFAVSYRCPKQMFSIRMSPFPQVLDLDGCFRSEKPYHCRSDSLCMRNGTKKTRNEKREKRILKITRNVPPLPDCPPPPNPPPPCSRKGEAQHYLSFSPQIFTPLKEHTSPGSRQGVYLCD